ncbi:alpha/beta hydrolase [Sphingomonas flavalba]|uniref:alpha/beta hydrolase n=1 Tax=Sphingomonas flavalba TaxID=2559804 RepID=UPI0039E064AD
MSEPFTLPATERLYLDRDGVGYGAYRLDVAAPSGVAPAAGWPSIWLLDAAGCFGTCVEALHRMSRRSDATGVSPMAVVGLSIVGDPYDAVRRGRDFTPSAKGSGKVDGSGGEAADFLSFLNGQVMNAVCDRVVLDRDRRTLFGHSLAGYFALWTLFHHPAAFRGYVAISPSIWWDRDLLFNAASVPARQGRRLFMAVGEWEEALPPWQVGKAGSEELRARRQARRMIANARELEEILRRTSEPDHVDFMAMAREDHASIVSTAMPHALRLASTF